MTPQPPHPHGVGEHQGGPSPSSPPLSTQGSGLPPPSNFPMGGSQPHTVGSWPYSCDAPRCGAKALLPHRVNVGAQWGHPAPNWGGGHQHSPIARLDFPLHSPIASLDFPLHSPIAHPNIPLYSPALPQFPHTPPFPPPRGRNVPPRPPPPLGQSRPRRCRTPRGGWGPPTSILVAGGGWGAGGGTLLLCGGRFSDANERRSAAAILGLLRAGGAAASGQRRSIPPPTAPPPAPHRAFPAFSPGFPPRSRSGLWGGDLERVRSSRGGGEGGGGPTYCGKRGGSGGGAAHPGPILSLPALICRAGGVQSAPGGRGGGRSRDPHPPPGSPMPRDPPLPASSPPAFPSPESCPPPFTPQTPTLWFPPILWDPVHITTPRP